MEKIALVLLGIILRINSGKPGLEGVGEERTRAAGLWVSSAWDLPRQTGPASGIKVKERPCAPFPRATDELRPSAQMTGSLWGRIHFTH